MKNLLMFLAFASMPAFAISLSCKINSSVDDGNTVTKTIELALPAEANPDACMKQEAYTIPGTQVEVTVYAHGACNPNPDFCSLAEPTVGGIQIHNKEGGDYSHTYTSCARKPNESQFLQQIVRGKHKVNVVAGCELM